MSSKIGRNDPCWCGSELKYKKCHLLRMGEPELPPPALISKFRRFFKLKQCLHPLASSKACGKVISAHTIQRKGALEGVVDETGHCLSFFPMDGRGSSEPQRRGWQEASTFAGFCDRHDGTTFAPLETNRFIGSPEQCFLLAYRAQCHELYQKQAAVRSLKPLGQLIDRGKPPEIQRAIQETHSWRGAGLRSGLQNCLHAKKQMDRDLLNNDFTRWERLFIRFKGPMTVVSTGAPTLNRSLSGKTLQILHDTRTRTQPLYLGVVQEDEGGAVVFTWSAQDQAPHQFIAELRRLPTRIVPGIVVQLMFAYIENSYFSAGWWNTLPEQCKQQVRLLAQMGNPYYTSWVYRDDLPVPWQVTGITQSWLAD